MADNLKQILGDLGLDIDKLPKEVTESNRSGDLVLAMLIQEVRGLQEQNTSHHEVFWQKMDCFEAKFNDRDGKKGVFTRLGILENNVTRLYVFLTGVAVSFAAYAIKDMFLG